LFLSGGSHSFQAAEKTLVVSELVSVFRRLIPNNIADECVFEHSRVCFAYLMEFAKGQPRICGVKEILCVSSRTPGLKMERPVFVVDDLLVDASELTLDEPHSVFLHYVMGSIDHFSFFCFLLN
jgi:hypothetical protein